MPDLPTHSLVTGLSSCTDQDAKPPTFLDTELAWSRAARQAKIKQASGQVLSKSDRYMTVLF